MSGSSSRREGGWLEELQDANSELEEKHPETNVSSVHASLVPLLGIWDSPHGYLEVLEGAGHNNSSNDKPMKQLSVLDTVGRQLGTIAVLAKCSETGEAKEEEQKGPEEQPHGDLVPDVVLKDRRGDQYVARLTITSTETPVPHTDGQTVMLDERVLSWGGGTEWSWQPNGGPELVVGCYFACWVQVECNFLGTLRTWFLNLETHNGHYSPFTPRALGLYTDSNFARDGRPPTEYLPITGACSCNVEKKLKVRFRFRKKDNRKSTPTRTYYRGFDERVIRLPNERLTHALRDTVQRIITEQQMFYQKNSATVLG